MGAAPWRANAGIKISTPALAFFRRLGIEIAENGFALAAAALRTFVLPFFPFLNGHHLGVFLIALLAAEFVIRHNILLLSFQQ